MLGWIGASSSMLPISRTRGEGIAILALPLSAALLVAADPSWAGKPISQWRPEDAIQVLADSPWVKHPAPAVLPERGEAQRRDGGKMGGAGKRAGFGQLDDSFLAGSARRGTLEVRWESATPVRAAEILAGEGGAPDWEGDYYAVAVYGVPGITPPVQKGLRGELGQTTFLKRSGKADLKPARVEIALPGARSARILYLFPRSAGIGPEDKYVEFVSQIGRIYIAQIFEIVEMQFHGKLEL